MQHVRDARRPESSPVRSGDESDGVRVTASGRERATTVAAMVRSRADDDNVGLVFGDRSWTWRQVVAEAATRAAWMRATLDPARPPHVGVLLPTVPEYVFQILGAAL